MNNYTFKVKMSCYNCVGEIIKTLSSEKIQNVNICLSKQIVCIGSDLTKERIIEIISTTGKIPIFLR